MNALKAERVLRLIVIIRNVAFASTLLGETCVDSGPILVTTETWRFGELAAVMPSRTRTALLGALREGVQDARCILLLSRGAGEVGRQGDP